MNEADNRSTNHSNMEGNPRMHGSKCQHYQTTRATSLVLEAADQLGKGESIILSENKEQQLHLAPEVRDLGCKDQHKRVNKKYINTKQ